MPSHGLISLPAELQMAIIDLLPLDNQRALFNLSGTCSFYRDLLAPSLFRSVTLRSTETCGASICTLAASPQARHVKELRYIGDNPTKDPKWDEKPWNDGITLPSSVGRVLSNFEMFPCLESLGIKFKFVWYWEMGENVYFRWPNEDEEQNAEGYGYGDDECPAHEDINEEQNRVWGALVTESYQALAKNTNSCIKRLEILNLATYISDAFHDQAFHKFLGTIEQFKLTIWGFDNGACWMCNKEEKYTEFVENLDVFFFNHLKKLTDLHFHGYSKGLLGNRAFNPTELALDQVEMPLIQSLDLGRIMLCPDLVTYLINHLDTLENIYLQECYAGVDEEEICWVDLFTAIADARPKKLERFEIEHPKEMFYDHIWPGQEAEGAEELANVEQIWKENPGRKMFPYVSVSDKYGTVHPAEHENRAKFIEGADQKAYDRLMDMVNANAIKITS